MFIKCHKTTNIYFRISFFLFEELLTMFLFIYILTRISRPHTFCPSFVRLTTAVGFISLLSDLSAIYLPSCPDVR